MMRAGLSRWSYRLCVAAWPLAALLIIAGCTRNLGDARRTAQPADNRPAQVYRGPGQAAPTVGQPPAPESAIKAEPLPPPSATEEQPGEATLPRNAVRVGILLPLSGAEAPVGRALLDAALLGVADTADDLLELRVYDTAAPGGSRLAAQSALADGARLVLGPLLSSDVAEATPVVRAAGVNLIAFSNNPAVAGPGSYVIGLSPRQQVRRIVAFARERGLERFAALVPESPFGQQAADDLRQAAAASGGTVVRVESYATTEQNDVASAIRHLVRGEGDPRFDAVLLPESGTRLRAVAPLLPYYGIDPAKVRLLGIASWSDPGLGREPALVGGWFAAPPPDAAADFAKRMTAIYGAAPHPLAGLAYDAAALAAVLARGEHGADFSAEALTQPRGFAGSSGIFRLLPAGETQRGLAVLEVTQAGPRVIAPAPESFDDLGQ